MFFFNNKYFIDTIVSIIFKDKTKQKTNTC